MHFDGWFGMGHWLWLLFWVALVAGAVWLAARMIQDERTCRGETPLELLDRRHAAGEISSSEYEERRARLIQDGERETPRK